MNCDFCGRDIDQRPIDQGGQPWLSRLEVIGTKLAAAINPSHDPNAFDTGKVNIQKNYHTTCLRLVNENERPR